MVKGTLSSSSCSSSCSFSSTITTSQWQGMDPERWPHCRSSEGECCECGCGEALAHLAEHLDCTTPDTRAWLDSICPNKQVHQISLDHFISLLYLYPQQCSQWCTQLCSCYCCYTTADSCKEICVCPDCTACQVTHKN